jgi:hypothetical protein
VGLEEKAGGKVEAKKGGKQGTTTARSEKRDMPGYIRYKEMRREVVWVRKGKENDSERRGRGDRKGEQRQEAKSGSRHY